MKEVFYTNVYLHNNTIYSRGYGNGKRFLDEVEYQPYLFVLGNGDYTTIYGECLQKQTFKSIKKAREFIEMYDGSSNAEYYGMKNFIYTFINDEFPDKIEFNSSIISVVSLDIEVDSRNGFPDIEKASNEITAITLTKQGRTITFGMKSYKPKSPNNEYVFCKDEKILLESFLFVWNTDEFWMPDVVTGWSVDLFDIPYLINRTRNLLGEKGVKKFSPIGYVEERQITRAKSNSYSKNAEDRQDTVYDIAGISVLDYLQLYKKFAVNARESYRLDFIAFFELGKRKVDYSHIGTLDDLYDKDPELFYDYNIQDALLVEQLEKKLSYLQIVFSLAYKAKVNYIDTMTTSRPWDAIIHSHLLKKNIAIPQIKVSDEMVRFTGAYNKHPKPGMYKWIVSEDFDALYPNIISQHNISPETYLRKFKNHGMYRLGSDGKIDTMDFDEILRQSLTLESNETMCINGAIFSKDKRGFIPELVDEFVAERAAVKKRMIELKKVGDKSGQIEHLDNYQKALKILNNGLYGAMGMKYFRWFFLVMAEAVTTTSQYATRRVEQKMNEYLNKLLKTKKEDYVIAADTDSVYLNLERLVENCGLSSEPTNRVIEFLDKACKEKFQHIIERCCLDVCKVLNVYKPMLVMKRDIIADKGCWRSAKMYILNVHDAEGVRYKEPELLMHGIEAIRSSTPFICRDAIRKCLKILMNDSEKDLQKFIKNFYIEFKKLPFEQVASPRSVNNLDEYFDPVTICRKGTPMHVRGALIYNHMLRSRKLINKIPLIRDKEKIRYSYLMLPNPAMSHVIAAPDTLPKELGLQNYVDYDTQFNKTFLDPIKSITDIAEWKTERKRTFV